MTWTDRSIQFDTKEEWLAFRRNGVGASEFAAILDRSHMKTRTPVAVFEEKADLQDERDPQEEKDLSRGNRAESGILSEYQDEHSDVLVRGESLMVVRHPVYPRVFCTPDALVRGYELLTREQLSEIVLPPGSDEFVRARRDPDGGVDAKFMDPFSLSKFGEEGTDEIPVDYQMQGVISCECLEVPYWDFACWFGRWKYREYRVKRDPELAELLIVEALSWYEKHVERKVAPEWDGSEASYRLIKRAWPKPELPVEKATAEALALHRSILSIEAEMAERAEALGAYKNRLRGLCKNHAGIDGVCTYGKNRDSEKVDWKAVVAHLSDKVDASILNPIIDANTTTKEGARVLRISR